MRLRVFAQISEHAFKTVRMLRQLRCVERLAKIQQMHVGIVESRADEAAGQIGADRFFIRQREDFFILADIFNPAVFNKEGLLQGLLPRIDFPVVKDASHACTSS